MKFDKYIFFLLCLLAGFSGSAQNVEFVENKGQWDSKVRFMSQVPGGAIFIHDKGFTIVQHHKEDLQELQEMAHGHGKAHHEHQNKNSSLKKLRSHAYRVDFIQSQQPVLIAEKPIESFSNYYIGKDPGKWAANCKSYQAITVKEIYPGVDVRYYADNGNLKYDFIVKAGADHSRIALKYVGVDKLEVKDKELVIGTSVGEVKELYPYSYQAGLKGRKEVPARYVVKGNVVSFDVKNLDPASPLVIDPRPIFATFSGSTADNWGFTATYGPDGAMYGGGIVFGAGFPVSPGAYDQTYNGGALDCTTPSASFDIGIIKLSANGSNRIYATYIGGSTGTEQPHSLVVDGTGNLVIAGRTISSDYPTTGSNGTIGKGGGYDVIVTKLNASGMLVGSKRIGGTGDDGVNIKPCHTGAFSLQYNYGDAGRSEVILDAAGNIYVASNTQSTSTTVADQFPTTAGAFQTTPGAKQDGVLLKLPPDVSALTFSSFIGGSDDDAAYVLALDPGGFIYVAGGTASSDLPGALNLYKGAIDGYVTVVSNNGSARVKTSYFGTGAYDQIYGIQFDRRGFPYIMGQTEGSWPVTTSWSQTGGKQFISKLNPDLSGMVYSTVFGTASAVPNISPVAFLVDRCENVYVSGWGGQVGASPSYKSAGTSGLTTVNPLQPNTDGRDFYFFVLKRDGTGQLYGDFFGQNGGTTDHVDGGTSRFDANGVIYQAICANCGDAGIPYPTSFGSWSPTNPSGRCNLAMVKIAMDLAGTASGVKAAINGIPDTSGCMPLRVAFRDTALKAKSYEWNFGDGSPQITTTSPDTSHLYTAVGSYRVMLVAIDSNSCNIRDTSYLTIRVGDLIAQLGFNAVKLDPCDEFKYRFDNTSVPPAPKPFGPQSFKWDFGDGSSLVTAGTASVFHQYASPGTYKVKLILNDTGYCNHPEFLEKTVRVAELVKADFSPPGKGCAPYTVTLENLSEGGQEFTWDLGDGTTSNAENVTKTYTVPGTYTITLTAVDSATCNITNTKQATVTVFGSPTANFTVSPQPPAVNTPITFTNLSSSDAQVFKWIFGDGDSLTTISREPVLHEYNDSKNFTACLIAYSDKGCPDSVCQDVRALIESALDVPNAFTPMSGDRNSVIYVRGFGIAKLRFVIWNRWGQKVFETESKNQGWDGTFKGVLQPMDVYAYTLEVEFTDGKKVNKKGDITLIR